MERTHLSRCLAGTRNFPMEHLPRLAEFLEVDPYELLGPEDPRAAVIELARLYRVTESELVAS